MTATVGMTFLFPNQLPANANNLKMAKYQTIMIVSDWTDYIITTLPMLTSSKPPIHTSLSSSSIFSIPAPSWVKPCHCFLSSYSALLPSALLFCSFMPPSFDPSPHHCFVLRGVKGCCYQRLAGLASAVLGRLAEWGRSYQQREPLPSARTSVSSSPAPRANYTLIARLERSPIRVGPFGMNFSP